jgi:hypothetical protein
MHGLALALAVVVRLWDTTNTPAGQLDRAIQGASATFQSAGVDIHWVVCPPSNASGCGAQSDGDALILRIIKTPPRVPDRQSLGFAWVDRDAGRGTVATVFADRTAALAQNAHVDAAVLLGRVIAHELGHLLLGTTTHPRRGLMRARWTVADLRRQLDTDWVFSSDEKARLREREAGPLPANN